MADCQGHTTIELYKYNHIYKECFICQIIINKVLKRKNAQFVLSYFCGNISSTLGMDVFIFTWLGRQNCKVGSVLSYWGNNEYIQLRQLYLHNLIILFY